jgi:hypothetical protein
VIAVSLSLGVLSIAAAIFFYLRSKRVRRLVYATSGVTLRAPSRPEFQKLALVYEGQRVPRLTVTDVLVWNSGTETVPGRDVSSVDPLRIEVPEGSQIFECIVTKSTREAVGAAVAVDPSMPAAPRLVFEFLDPNGGFALQVVHTAEKPEMLVVRGTAQGIGEVRRVEGPRGQSRDWQLALIRLLFVVPAAGSVLFSFLAFALKGKRLGIIIRVADVPVWNLYVLIAFTVGAGIWGLVASAHLRGPRPPSALSSP